MSNLGNKIIMANNIKKYLIKNNQSQTEICKLLNFKETTFSDWINAKTYPRIDSIEKLANYFGVEKSDLIEDETKILKTKGVQIPVLGKVAAGIAIEAVENIIGYEEISEEMAKTGDYFCLEIKGDSMAPEIKEKAIVVIKKQSTIESGEIGVVFINGSDATVKRVIKHVSGISLISFNPVYLPKFYTCEEVENIPIEIIGRVVESRTKY